MLLLLLLGQSLSALDTEDLAIPVFYEEENLKATQDISDPVSRSDKAFVSSYTGESDKDFGYLKMLLVLGYTLKTVSPSVDRVLLLPNTLEFDPSIITMLKKVWPTMVYRPFIQWPRNWNVTIQQQQRLFKLQAWSIRGYQKLFYIGADTLLFSDFGELFNTPAPASVVDFYTFTTDHQGATVNTDFMIFEPNTNDYMGLLREASSFYRNWKDSGPRNVYGGSMGEFDQLIINSYFKGRFFILPMNYIHENGGSTDHILGDPHRDMKEVRVMGIHFGKEGKPWLDKRKSLYIEIWKIFASNCFEKLDIPFDVGATLETADELLRVFWAANNKRKKSLRFREENEEIENELIDVYPEISNLNTKKLFSISLLFIFGTLFLVKNLTRGSNPFNVMKKMEMKISEFVRLDDLPEEISTNPPQVYQPFSLRNN